MMDSKSRVRRVSRTAVIGSAPWLGKRAGRISLRSGRLDREDDDVALLPAELHTDQVDRKA